MFALVGIPGFAGGSYVPLSIDYTDFVHLLPLYVALLLYGLRLLLLSPYLMHASSRDEAMLYKTGRIQ